MAQQSAEAAEAQEQAQDEPVVETGVRVKGVLCRGIAELAIKRRQSLDTIARLAMREFARQRGIELQGGDRIVDSRASDETLRAADERKVWIAYPESWREGLEQLLAMDPAIVHQSSLWKRAMVQSCRDGGTITGA